MFALAVAPESLTHRGDPRFFHLAANLLADGHGYIAPLPFLDHGTVIASTEHPPLWSALLAVFSAVGGRSYAAHEMVACGVGAATVACAGLLGLSVTRAFWPAGALLAVVGFTATLTAIGCNTSLQLAAPDALRGRIMSLYTVLSGGIFPVSAFFVGAISEAAGVSRAFAVNGLLGLAALALLVSLRRRRG